MAEEAGISVEFIDPRTLVPLDEETIVNSVKKTGRAVVLCQAPETGCYAEHIARVIYDQCFSALKGAVTVIGACDVPPPMAQTLESENLPSPEKVFKAIQDVVAGE